MCRIHIVSRRSLLLIVSLTFFVLAACGPNRGVGSGAGSTPTPTPTTIQGEGTAYGCPSNTVVTTTPPAANLTVNLTDANSTVTAHVGDVIEIQLPFGLSWAGPTTEFSVHRPVVCWHKQFAKGGRLGMHPECLGVTASCGASTRRKLVVDLHPTPILKLKRGHGFFLTKRHQAAGSTG